MNTRDPRAMAGRLALGTFRSIVVAQPSVRVRFGGGRGGRRVSRGIPAFIVPRLSTTGLPLPRVSAPVAPARSSWALPALHGGTRTRRRFAVSPKWAEVGTCIFPRAFEGLSPLRSAHMAHRAISYACTASIAQSGPTVSSSASPSILPRRRPSHPPQLSAPASGRWLHVRPSSSIPAAISRGRGRDCTEGMRAAGAQLRIMPHGAGGRDAALFRFGRRMGSDLAYTLAQPCTSLARASRTTRLGRSGAHGSGSRTGAKPITVDALVRPRHVVRGSRIRPDRRVQIISRLVDSFRGRPNCTGSLGARARLAVNGRLGPPPRQRTARASADSDHRGGW
ncbi:hypothetical protein B0H10DRAFT_633270 [Mycena sp. CBHHK59/15]|nr:hypothetical protein B0H10DRAFT_633270 [Mycena sp. CBHHK59/15]